MFNGPPPNSAGLFNKNSQVGLQNNTPISNFSLGNNQGNSNQMGLFNNTNNNNQNSGIRIGSNTGQGNMFSKNNSQNTFRPQQ